VACESYWLNSLTSEGAVVILLPDEAPQLQALPIVTLALSVVEQNLGFQEARG